jgi:hypothetical protein
MVRLIDPQFRIAQQQQRLAEKRLQLENDPNRIFLRSLAQSVPQELIRGGVQIGRDALGYKFFGGERELARREAEAFGAARPGFFKEYQPEAYARYQDQQQQRARQIKEQQAARRKQQERQATPRQPVMPEFQDAGDGKFIMKVPSGQNYLVSKEEKDSMEAGFKRGKKEGIKAKETQQPSAPSYDFSNLQREQQKTMSTTTGASLQLPEKPDFFASSTEQIKYNERLQKSREAVFKRQSEEAVKRRERLQKATEDQLKRLYDFLPQVSAEELARQAALLDQMIATEPNAEVRELLSIAKSQLPSEEFRANAAQYIGKSGNRRWSKISKSMPTRISFQAQRQSVLEAVKRRTAEIERLEQLPQTPEIIQEIETLKLANRTDVNRKGLREAVPLKDDKLMATSDEMKARAGKGTPGLSAVEFANASNYADANQASIEAELKSNPQAKKKFDSQMIASTKRYKENNPGATDEQASKFGFTMAYQATFNPETSVLRRSDKKGTSGDSSTEFTNWVSESDSLLKNMKFAPLSLAERDWAERNFISVGNDNMRKAIGNIVSPAAHTNESGKGTAKRLEDAVNALE